MNEQILEWIKRPNNFIVILKHEDIYGTVCVTCTLDRCLKTIPISVLARTEEDAVLRTKKILDKLESLGKIEPPTLADQPSNNGYFRRMYGNKKVEFKNIEGRFHITDINEYDGDDFRVLEEPLRLEDFAKDQHTFKKVGEVDEYEIYFYDNTASLAGNGGLVKIKDGKIIARKMTFMS